MSRSNRDKWQFIKHPVRKALSIQEVNYWKASLWKILKVGIELEFNLPEASGGCKQKNPACVCINFKPDRDCWTLCALTKSCSRIKAGKECLGKNCSSFTSACLTCLDFQTPCKGCTFRFDPKKDPEQLRSNIMGDLNPSNHYGNITKDGVHSVIGDGSLLGGKAKNKGVEVITVGRRVDYWEFYKMAKSILDTAVKNGAWLNERCSIHMHLLTSYYNSEKSSYINEMEKDMPEIIAANFHQLVRRYQNALVWMTLGLDRSDRLTRWERYRVSVMSISAMKNCMSDVKALTYEHSGGNKYSFANYTNMLFGRTNDVETFHVELRYMDGIISPSIIAAMACLNHALVIKAAEISRYGLLKMPDNEWLKEARQMKKLILNNMKPYGDGDRFGHTPHVLENKEYFIRESLGLVQQMKHILMKTGPAYEVLEKLAETPAALLRVEGRSWEQIENIMQVEMADENILNAAIHEYIDLRLVDKCKTMEEWIKGVTISMWEDKDNTETLQSADVKDMDSLEKYITDTIKEEQTDGMLIWSDSLGAIVSV